MSQIKLKATFERETLTGYQYTVSSLSRDEKTAQADMDFFHENYTELSTTGNRAEGAFYSNELYPKRFGHATLTYDENPKTGKSYWNLHAPEDLLEETAIRKMMNRGANRGSAPQRRRVEIEVNNNDDADLD